MRDVNEGWMLRYSHANMASFFFIAVRLIRPQCLFNLIL